MNGEKLPASSEAHPPRAEYYQSVRGVLWAVLISNLLVTTVKVTLGIITGALAVVADGFHSLVDTSSNLIGLAAIRLARRPADEAHPYGYRRYETLGALAIGGLLLVAAWELGTAIVERLLEGTTPQVDALALGLIALTFPVNVLIVWLETRAGKRLNSEILLADAKHTLTDLYVTGSVIISVLGVWMGWTWLDPLVAAAVVVLILRAAFNILGSTAKWLADSIVVEASQVEALAMNVPGVRFVHRVRSRGTPDAAFVDLHVKVAPGMSTGQAHAIASEVERRLVAELPEVTDALVHIEPARVEKSTPWERMATDLRQLADGMGLGIHDLHIHTNLEGEQTIELHLEMGGEVSLGEAHALADKFEGRVQARWPQATRIITHLEPIPQKVLLPDQQYAAQFEQQIRQLLSDQVGAHSVQEVQCYRLSGKLNAAVVVRLPAELPLAEAHTISERLETSLLQGVEGLQRITVHLEPEGQ